MPASASPIAARQNPRLPGIVCSRIWLLFHEESLKGSDVVKDTQALIAQATSTGATLIERHEAFGELVTRFQDLAFGCAYAVLHDFYLAEDAAQEAFITAW